MNEMNEGPPPKDKKKSSRAVVRKALRDERAVLKKLRMRMADGENLAEDIEACKGQIEILFKELQSIEEGGHTTFLKAKDIISPKKNVAEKKNRLRDLMDEMKSKILKIEKSLDTPNLPKDERDKKLVKSSKLQSELEDLKQEYNALLQYNHTNFVTSRDEDRKQTQMTKEVELLQAKIVEIKKQMKDCADAQDFKAYAELELQLDKNESDLKKIIEPAVDLLKDSNDENQFEDPFLES